MVALSSAGASQKMTRVAHMPRWERDGDTLWCAIETHPELKRLALEQVAHRLRTLLARPYGLLHPASAAFEDGRLVLRFAPKLLDAGPGPADLPFRRWRDTVLLPLLDALCACHEHQIVGFAPRRPLYCRGGGRWVSPPSWFLPGVAPSDEVIARRADCLLTAEWLSDELSRRRMQPGERRQVEALRAALQEGDGQALRRRVDADRVEAAQDVRRQPYAPTFLCQLTEAELLERMATVYSYQALSDVEARRFGGRGGAERVLLVDPNWRDPHFPAIERPLPSELWETLLEESKTTRLLAPSLLLPNPLDASLEDIPTVHWIGVREDPPLFFVEPEATLLPAQGFVRLYEPGDVVLLGRKRTFVSFAGDHPALADLLSTPPPARPFVENPQRREDLEEAVLATSGVFAVQGPPGTGKTHLATEVVRRFLERNPAGRVLVCAKEHFALDHIARKITGALQKRGMPLLAWRSVSRAKLQRDPGEIDDTWLGPSVIRRLAALIWSEESQGWAVLGAIGSEEHDQRLASLGRQAANLFFCTTLDRAMVEFLGRDSFDLVIVEEAGKCYPSELLHAVCLGRTVLLIGDQRQLPPFQERQTRNHLQEWHDALNLASQDLRHREALAERFGETFHQLEALHREHGPLSEEEQSWLRPFEYLFDRLSHRHRLEEQFRMEAPLSRVIGSVFYGKPFVHRKQELRDAGILDARPLGEVIPPELDVPLLWINTPHASKDTRAAEGNEVRTNAFERDLILKYLRRLRPGSPIDLVILTPYRAQKRLLLGSKELQALCKQLTDMAFEQVVRTTDEYQGREAELTILSLVRNNRLSARAWGFMTEPERLNVMFSRTRFRQVVIGCGAHIEQHGQEAPELLAFWEAYQLEARDRSCARILRPTELAHG